MNESICSITTMKKLKMRILSEEERVNSGRWCWGLDMRGSCLNVHFGSHHLSTHKENHVRHSIYRFSLRKWTSFFTIHVQIVQTERN